MMKPIRIETTSANGSKLNLEALYQIAPSCFTEEKDEKTGTVKHVVNFKTLRQLLGDDAVEDSEEMYQFTWPGKQAARYEAATPIADTLRPVTEDSVDWDTTQNLYIEGDNLRVLKLLQKSYMGKVKMIYIDPPYNTGNDFVYHDDFAVDSEQYVVDNGDRDTEGYRYRKNLDGNGRFHSDWCSMMYSRLLVARSLLTEDGVIFISIDDNEVHNLRKICDEVLGARNFVAELVWKSKSGGANDSRFFATDHEYVLTYAKNTDSLSINIDKNATVTTVYNQKDEKGEYSLDRLDKQSLGYIESLDFPIIAPDGTTYTVYHRNPNQKIARWRWSKETVEKRFNELVFKDGNVYTKNYKKEGSIPRSLLIEERFGRTRTGKTDFTSLFEGAYFSAPKPYKLVYFLTNIGTSPDSLILDFFSGSATTAHAVMKLNAEDGGKRKYIMVQYAEDTPEKSEARKAGYKNICEIGKERIRRAGKKIKEESPLTTQHLDTGFRVFRLDGSNYEDVTKQPGEYDQRTLDLFADNIKADRTDLDLLFGAMLSWGVQLSLSMTTEEVDGCKIYTVDDGGLVACFAENITENVAKAMADKLPVRVLFRDSCFGEDKTKINIFELFKQQLNWDDKEAKENIRVI
jgi:type III restriction-modification system methyltransferase